MEAEALKKQIAALEESKQESDSKLAALEGEHRAAEEARIKIQELEDSIEANRLIALQELETIKAEKEAETKSIREELSGLTNELKHLREPWWKKWFSAGSAVN